MNQDEEAGDSFQRQSLDVPTTKKGGMERQKTLIRKSNMFETENVIECFDENDLSQNAKDQIRNIAQEEDEGLLKPLDQK